MTSSAVVTGMGILAPNGIGVEDYWQATLNGLSGIKTINRFDPQQYPAQLAGEVPELHAEEILGGRLMPQTDHMTRMALIASDSAFNDSGIAQESIPEFGAGVITASSSGGFEFGHRELHNLWSKGGQYVSAYQSFAWFYAVNTGQISIRHGLRGPSGVLVSDQAGGLDAIAHARRQIRKGIGLILSGGMDSGLCPWGWVAQIASGRLTKKVDPRLAYRPFVADADGFVAGEGGAILVVEDQDAARLRSAKTIYGAIAGYGATFDPGPDTGRDPGLRGAIELALADAGVAPNEVDVVFADAAGLPDLDRIEVDAIAGVFGPHAVPVTAPKTMTGRLYSGGAALDTATALLAMRDGVIPPTIHIDPAPTLPIDLVEHPRSRRVSSALVLARGYGGFNSALLVSATR